MDEALLDRFNATHSGAANETLAARTRRALREQTAAFRNSRVRCERVVACIVLLGDSIAVVGGFILAFWLRYYSGLFEFLTPMPRPAVGVMTAPVVMWDYWRLILLGTVLVFGGLISKSTYELRDLLSLRRFMNRFGALLTFCLFIFIGLSLAVQTNPPISRAWVILSWFSVFVLMFVWRLVVSRILRWPTLGRRLRKRVIVIGATLETVRLQETLARSLEYEYVGWIEGLVSNRHDQLLSTRRGSLHNLESILGENYADIAILAEAEALQREGVAYILRVCERQHIQFKLVPHFMETLISGLRPSKLGGLTVLGVDSLPLQAYQNRIFKRTMDILGGAIGIVLCLPLIAVFSLLVYLESPGPVIYRQRRTSRNGRDFMIYKIRSMRIDAEANGKPGWSSAVDNRRLRIGAFIRKWNIDETPQFFNVLIGDMSLVGPRPERPELIEHFQHTVPHYQLRHYCRAGMTGWAQVNGWRGDTDLEERIRCDIWYVEHWSILLDLRIMLQTLLRSKNAY